MLVRHVAGVPTATEQRCIRCCEVILRCPPAFSVSAFPRGTEVVTENGSAFLDQDREFFADDCAPHDPQAEGEYDMAVPEHLR
jgi:hypothetical protein